MTNGEKFEEVFGMKVDPHADDPCCIVKGECRAHAENLSVPIILKHDACVYCALHDFWDKEYVETSKDSENISKAFILGGLFVTVASRDQVVSMIMKQMEDIELKEKENRQHELESEGKKNE